MKRQGRKESFRLNGIAACLLAAFGSGQALAAQQIYEGPGDIYKIGRPVGRLQNGSTAVFVDAVMNRVANENEQAPGSSGVAYGTRRFLNDYFIDVIPKVQNASPQSVVIKGSHAYIVDQDNLFVSNRTDKNSATEISYNPDAIKELNSSRLPGIVSAKAIGPVVNPGATITVGGIDREVASWYITAANELYVTYGNIGGYTRLSPYSPTATRVAQSGTPLVISDYVVLPETILFKATNGNIYMISTSYRGGLFSESINGISYLSQLRDMYQVPLTGLDFTSIKNTIHSAGGNNFRYLFKSGTDWYSLNIANLDVFQIFNDSELIGVDFDQQYSGRFVGGNLYLDDTDSLGAFDAKTIMAVGYNNRAEFSKLLATAKSVCNSGEEIYYALGVGEDNRLTALTIKVSNHLGYNGMYANGVVTDVYRGATVDSSTLSATARMASAIDPGTYNFVDRSDTNNPNCSAASPAALSKAGFYITSNGVSIRLSHNADTNLWEETSAPNSDGAVTFPRITRTGAQEGAKAGNASTNFAFANSTPCSLITPNGTQFCSVSASPAIGASKDNPLFREIMPGGVTGKFIQSTGQFSIIDSSSGSVDYLTSLTYASSFGEKHNVFNNITSDWGLGDVNSQRPAADPDTLISPNSGTAWNIDASGRITLTGPISSRLTDNFGNRGSMQFQNSPGGVFAFGTSTGFELPIAPDPSAQITGSKGKYSNKIDVDWDVAGGPYRLMVRDANGGTWSVLQSGFSGAQTFSWTDAKPWMTYEFSLGYDGSSSYFNKPGSSTPLNAWTRSSGCDIDTNIWQYRCFGSLNSPPMLNVSKYFDMYWHKSQNVRNTDDGVENSLKITAPDGMPVPFGYTFMDPEYSDEATSAQIRDSSVIVRQTGEFGVVTKTTTPGGGYYGSDPFSTLTYTPNPGSGNGIDTITMLGTDQDGASVEQSFYVYRVAGETPMKFTPAKELTLTETGSKVYVLKKDNSFGSAKLTGVDTVNPYDLELVSPWTESGMTEAATNTTHPLILNWSQPGSISTYPFRLSVRKQGASGEDSVSLPDEVTGQYIMDPWLDPRIKISTDDAAAIPETGAYTFPVAFGVLPTDWTYPANADAQSVPVYDNLSHAGANWYNYTIALVYKDANGKYVAALDNGQPITTSVDASTSVASLNVSDMSKLKGKTYYLAAAISDIVHDFDPNYTVFSKPIPIGSSAPTYTSLKGSVTADSSQAMLIGNDGSFISMNIAGLGAGKNGYVRLTESGMTPIQISNVSDNLTKDVKFPMKSGTYTAWSKHSATLSLNDTSNKVLWSEVVTGVFLPAQGVNARVTTSQNSYAAGQTFNLPARVGIPNTISVANDARVGQWKVWVGEKVNGSFVDIAGPVTTDASGNVSFSGLSVDEMSGKTLFLRGEAVLPSGISFADSANIPKFSSTVGFPIATAGEGGGIVSTDVSEGTLPFIAKINLMQSAEQTAVTKGLAWEYSADGGSTWIALPVSTRSASFTPIKGGAYLVRASMLHSVTNQKVFTNAVPITVHEKFTTTLTAPAIVLPNTEVEVKAVVLNYQKRPVVPASYVLDWEVTMPGESAATTYSNVSSIKINSAVAGNALIKVKARPVWMDAADADSITITEKTVQYGIGQTPITEVRGPKFIESGRPATFTAKMVAPWGTKVKTDLKIEGEWEMPDGTTVPGATLTYTPPAATAPAPGSVSAATVINNVDIKFRSWVTGAKDQTTVVKTYPIRVFNYTLPNFVLKPALDAGYAPANLLLRVMPETIDDLKTMSGHRYSYSWTIPDGATAVAKGATAYSKIDMPGTYDFVVKVDDDRGNSKEFTYSTTIEQMIPYSMNIVPRPMLPFERAPMSYLLKLNITGGHPKDRIIGYTLKINDEQIGGVMTKPPAMVSGLVEGSHKIDVEFMTRLGTGATASTTVNVAANQPPVCDITEQRWTGSTNVKLNAACKDNDGKIKLVTWKLDGVPVERPSPSIYLDMKDKTSVEVELNVTDDSAAVTTVSKTVTKQ